VSQSVAAGSVFAEMSLTIKYQQKQGTP